MISHHVAILEFYFNPYCYICQGQLKLIKRRHIQKNRTKAMTFFSLGPQYTIYTQFQTLKNHDHQISGTIDFE